VDITVKFKVTAALSTHQDFETHRSNQFTSSFRQPGNLHDASRTHDFETDAACDLLAAAAYSKQHK
jgi:hypothetical protein